MNSEWPFWIITSNFQKHIMINGKARKIYKALFYVFSFLLLAICSLSCTKSRVKSVVQDFLDHTVELNQLSIDYPKNKTLFPIDFQAPTIRWTDSLDVNSGWLACISDTLGNIILDKFVEKKEWKPDSLDWEELKRNHTAENLQVTIIGFNSKDKTENNSYAKISE